MRAVFLGSPSAAVPALAALAEIAEIMAVVTNPDRPRGRGGNVAATPVKLAAEQWGLPLAQPRSSRELIDELGGTEADVAVVVAYGRILTKEALATTRVGFVNLHFSVLPRWRGASPVEHAILAGDTETGVSLMWLDEGLDTGPVVAVRKTPIADTDTGGTLTAKLSALAAAMLVDALPGFVSGALVPAEQLDAGVTHARRLETGDGELDAGRPADELERRVRAMHPRPGAWLIADGVRLKVLAARPVDALLPAGRIEKLGDLVVLGTADRGLALEVVQPAGKTVQSGETWMNGRRGEPATAGAS